MDHQQAGQNHTINNQSPDRRCGRKKAVVEYGPAVLADMRSNWADVRKAGELLGWEPQFNLREGVKQLANWYNAERDWARDVLTP
jgi:nucleoside-diphosphate-sugar epimerase